MQMKAGAIRWAPFTWSQNFLGSLAPGRNQSGYDNITTRLCFQYNMFFFFIIIFLFSLHVFHNRFLNKIPHMKVKGDRHYFPEMLNHNKKQLETKYWQVMYINFPVDINFSCVIFFFLSLHVFPILNFWTFLASAVHTLGSGLLFHKLSSPHINCKYHG